MSHLYLLNLILDLLGTFAFAISGAVAAKRRGLDLMGIAVIAFFVACGGGIVRDICLNVLPVGLSDLKYLITALIATFFVITSSHLVNRLERPVTFFDAIGLAFFAVSGAQKVLWHHDNAEFAIVLGTVSAVGGGVLRDILMSRLPIILEKDIYATAALVGAGLYVLLHYLGLNSWIDSLISIAVCLSLRLLAMHFKWSLPHFKESDNQ